MNDHHANSEAPRPGAQIDRMVDELDLPPCPAVLTQLLRETRAETPDLQRVSRLVGRDAALASAALRVVNSPFYGLRTPAATVQDAVVMLGMNQITQLVTGLLLRQAFPTLSGPAMEAYWKRSMATALIAPLVCRDLRRGDGALAATFALFRDCGMPVMLLKFPTYTDILDGSALVPEEPVLETENQRYPVNHAALGAALAQSWHLSPVLCDAVRHHHDVFSAEGLPTSLDAQVRQLIACACAAERLHALTTLGPCPEWHAVGDWVLAELGMDEHHFGVLAASVATSIRRL